MQLKFYMSCTNPSCKFNAIDDSSVKFCPHCGSKLADRCPHCEEPLKFRDQTNCTACAKPLKEAPVADQAQA